MFATFCWWLIAGGVGNDRHGPREPLKPPGGAADTTRDFTQLDERASGGFQRHILGFGHLRHSRLTQPPDESMFSRLLFYLFFFFVLTMVLAMECWHFRNTS